MGRYDLNKYDVIIMPSTRGGGLNKAAQDKGGQDWGKKLVESDSRLTERLNFFCKQRKDLHWRILTQYEEEKRPLEKVQNFTSAKAERLAPLHGRWAIGDLRWNAAGAIYQVAMIGKHTHFGLLERVGKFYALEDNSSKLCLSDEKGSNAGKSCQMDSLPYRLHRL